MKEQLLQAVRDLNARTTYYRTVYEAHRNALTAAPVSEVTDNRRSRIRISLIGPAFHKQIQDTLDSASDTYRASTDGRTHTDLTSIEHLISELPDGDLTQGQKAQINSILETYAKITTGPVVHLIKELRNAL